MEPRLRLGRRLALAALGLIALVAAHPALTTRAEVPPHLGYGTTGGAEALGFDWVKTLGSPAGGEARKLVRLDFQASHLASLDGWLADLDGNVRRWAEVADAYEIGNEPNLDASYGWGAPPNAADYTHGLCRAYSTIKAADPDALVVSAGMAPTGRIPFVWQGHRGYCAPGVEWCPSYYQDEREYLREMLGAGAEACFDALGYHPYGFGAPYDAAPGSSECGPNDFCFRGVEPIHDILANEFGLRQPVWATEFGWIVDPRLVGEPECWEDPTMQGFQWMVVTPEAQATNLVDAYQYAESHYPWMGAMFLFSYGVGRGCDQMHFFDIRGRPAEAALAAMPKHPVPSQALWRGPRSVVAEAGTQSTISGELWLDNLAAGRLSWRAEAVPDASLAGRIELFPSEGVPGQPLRWEVDPAGLEAGLYTVTLRLTAQAPLGLPLEGGEQDLEIGLLLARERVDLPLVMRQG